MIVVWFLLACVPGFACGWVAADLWDDDRQLLSAVVFATGVVLTSLLVTEVLS